MRKGWLAFLVFALAVTVNVGPRAQPPVPPSGSSGAATAVGKASDLELVEKLLVVRKDYQKSLENLRTHYFKVGDIERAKWAEEELRQYQRIAKQAFRLDLDLPPPTLVGNTNVPEANKLFMAAMSYKDKGWGTDYIDNQRRAEILFQKVLSDYPQSNKIDDVAYMLGDLYESKAYKQHRRAAAYYERCFQWNPKTNREARIRAARIYDKQLSERAKAIELYREVVNHETDQRLTQEATKRAADLSGTR